jgi:hypothetical protein
VRLVVVIRPLTVLCVSAVLAACTAAPSSTGSGASAAPAASSSGPADAEVTALLARPLRVATVAPGADCPVTRPRALTTTEGSYSANPYGAGPLYPMSGYLGPDTTLRLRTSQGADGLYENKVVWVSRGGEPGSAVVRVARLDGAGRGRVRLYYDPAAARGDAVLFGLTAQPASWPAGTFVSGPGCYAYQVDGRGFTDVIVFRVTS